MSQDVEETDDNVPYQHLFRCADDHIFRFTEQTRKDAMCIQVHTDLFVLRDLVDKASVLKQLVERGILDLFHPEE